MEMKKVAMYIRVGNQSQLEEKAELQKKVLKDYAKKNGFSITQEYIDLGYTGRSLDRPGMQALLSEIERGKIESVLVANRSQLSRNPAHRNFPCEVISLTDDTKYIAESNRLAAAIRERMAYIESSKQAAKGCL